MIVGNWSAISLLARVATRLQPSEDSVHPKAPIVELLESTMPNDRALGEQVTCF